MLVILLALTDTGTPKYPKLTNKVEITWKQHAMPTKPPTEHNSIHFKQCDIENWETYAVRYLEH